MPVRNASLRREGHNAPKTVNRAGEEGRNRRDLRWHSPLQSRYSRRAELDECLITSVLATCVEVTLREVNLQGDILCTKLLVVKHPTYMRMQTTRSVGRGQATSQLLCLRRHQPLCVPSAKLVDDSSLLAESGEPVLVRELQTPRKRRVIAVCDLVQRTH
jgi:hypothetical protein